MFRLFVVLSITCLSLIPVWSMSAIIATDYVGTDWDELVYTQIPPPKISALSPVLIQINASSVNPVDYKIIEGPLFPLKFPVTLGFDVAGIVKQCYKCTRLRVNDAVWFDAGSAMGAYAEYIVANEEAVGLAPKSLGASVEAAVLPLVSLTGYQAFLRAGAPWTSKQNITVAISTGSGGTGIVGIQIAKALGASTVITSCGTANLALCRSLGADVVIDYHEASIWDVLSNDSVDMVFENLGRDTADEAISKIRYGGAFIYIAGPAPTVKKEGVKVEFFLTNSDHHADLDALAAMVDAGELYPVVQDVLSLADIPAAFSIQEAGHVTGKLGIRIGY